METSIISIKRLISEEQCYKTIRPLRWSGKIGCPHCDSENLIKRGRWVSGFDSIVVFLRISYPYI
ncbi:MAG: transposase [Methylococcales bacterium]|nr:transposase [Methylococcales bacterium]